MPSERAVTSGSKQGDGFADWVCGAGGGCLPYGKLGQVVPAMAVAMQRDRHSVDFGRTVAPETFRKAGADLARIFSAGCRGCSELSQEQTYVSSY